MVEDDPSLGYIMKDNLDENYEVHWVMDGGHVIEKLSQLSIDLILLDVMLPKIDGFSLAEEIRAANKGIPILFVSARSLEEDRLKGFLKGGDDYITKPFSMDELKMRIEVFLKRSGIGIRNEKEFKIGAYTFIPDNLMLIHSDEERKLTRRESELLQYLITRKGKVIKREDILNALWGNDDYFSGRSLDVFISKLRKYLNHDPTIQINNYHAVGFQFECKD